MSSGGGGFNPIKAVTGTLGNFVGDITGANASADAAQGAANAQLAQQRGDRGAAMQLAAPSDMEMAQLEQAVTMNSQDVARKQKILDSADPALIEAGHQALALMQGQSASTLKPLQNQRDRQRAQLEQTLAQRLGPEYATSTAGIQALNNFDMQTSDLMATQQQQTLSNFMGYTGMAVQAGSMQPNIQNSQSIAAQRGSINARQVNALNGSAVDPGLGFVGDIGKAQASQGFLSQQFNQFLNPGAISARGEQTAAALAQAAAKSGAPA